MIEINCIICFEDLQADDVYYQCGLVENHEHTMCISCFGNYVNHCCMNYAVGQMIPISCSIPECSYIVSHDRLEELLMNNSLLEMKLWDLYQRTCVFVALDTLLKDKGEYTISCSLCNYKELIDPPPEGFWKQLTRVRQYGKILAQGEVQDFSIKKKKQISAKCQEQRSTINNDSESQLSYVREQLQQAIQSADVIFNEKKTEAEEYKAINMEKVMMDMSSIESSYWEEVQDMHIVYWDEPLGSRSNENEQVKMMLTSNGNEEEDIMLLFEVIPLPSENDSEERRSMLKSKIIRKHRMKCKMLNQELQTAIRNVDGAYFQYEMVFEESLKQFQQEYEESLAEPRSLEQKAVEEIEDARKEALQAIDNVEVSELHDVDNEAEVLLNRKLTAFISPKVQIQLREILHLKESKNKEDNKEPVEDVTIKKRKRSFIKSVKKMITGEEKKQTKSKLMSDNEDVDINKLIDSINDDIKLDYSGETSMYFICKSDGCKGVVCLKCDARLTDDQVNDHICRIDEIGFLYDKLLEILATASSQSCPGCKEVWMKDLACTHMYCEKCSTYWCYGCGKSRDKDLGGDFSNHNEWYTDTPETDQKCPMYLQYRWGDQDVPESRRKDGDPLKAMEAFHKWRQEKMIQDFVETVNESKWDEMIKKYFPLGIWGENQVKEQDS